MLPALCPSIRFETSTRRRRRRRGHPDCGGAWERRAVGTRVERSTGLRLPVVLFLGRGSARGHGADIQEIFSFLFSSFFWRTMLASVRTYSSRSSWWVEKAKTSQKADPCLGHRHALQNAEIPSKHERRGACRGSPDVHGQPRENDGLSGTV